MPSNLGLLSGLAMGLKGGMDGYMAAQKMNNDKRRLDIMESRSKEDAASKQLDAIIKSGQLDEMRRKLNQADSSQIGEMKKAGYVPKMKPKYDDNMIMGGLGAPIPTSYEVVPNEWEMEEWLKQKLSGESALKGAQTEKFGADTEKIRGLLQPSIDQINAKIGLLGAQTKKASEEAKAIPIKSSQKSAGKMLPAKLVTTLSEGQNFPAIMKDLNNVISQNSSVFGPARGRVGMINPWDDKAKAVQATLDVTKQMVGKYIEGGVLRKEDEIKYMKMLPVLSDTPQTAKNKAQLMEQTLARDINAAIRALKGSGYDTSAFSQIGIRGLPDVLSGGGKKPSGPSVEDKKAIDWLSKNPNHKSADGVRKKLKAKGLL